MISKRFSSKVPVCLIAALECVASFTAGAEAPSFTFAFDRQHLRLSGAPGTKASTTLMGVIQTRDNSTSDGIASWQLSVAIEGSIAFSEASFEETDGDALFRDGFRHMELTTGEGNEGFICGVILSLREASTLPPNGDASVARATVVATLPAAGATATGRIEYRDDLVGKGLPIKNLVVFGTESYSPVLSSIDATVEGVTPPRFIRGDLDASGRISIGDPVLILLYLFLDLDLQCVSAADSDDDGKVSVVDAVRLLNYLFLNGAPPSPPFPGCGIDPSPGEDLAQECRGHAACGSG